MNVVAVSTSAVALARGDQDGRLAHVVTLCFHPHASRISHVDERACCDEGPLLFRAVVGVLVLLITVPEHDAVSLLAVVVVAVNVAALTRVVVFVASAFFQGCERRETRTLHPLRILGRVLVEPLDAL